MSLAGLEFAFFFPVVFLLYWLGPHRASWQNAVLMLASAVFYATWDMSLLAVLAGAMVVSFGAGLALGAPSLEEGPAADDTTVRRRRRAILAVAIGAELGLLGVFKYAGFFAGSLNALLSAAGLPDMLPVLRLALPLGISYTTLIQVGYLLEVYWRRTPACRDPLAYATFVAFFPQLLAGPIVRAPGMLRQYGAARLLSPDVLASGAGAFLLGFAMKAFVADWLSPRVVDPVFANPAAYTAGTLWLSLLGYATQLFCDFAGYSLMAIGTGRMFGLELPENFRYPFLSKSLAEFWRRWHISLNTWLFDYLFAPLTTGRSWFRGRAGAGFLVVFLVSGLWHGATWTFVLWGLAHGVALAIHHTYDLWYKGRCRKDRRYVAWRKAGPYVLASWAVTQLFFLLTLIPFRAPDLSAASAFATGLLGFGGQSGLAERFGLQAAACVLFMLFFHLLEVGRGPALKQGFLALPAPLRGIVYGLILAFLMVYVPVGASTFIYAQF
jgi:D-alanyl-lipoteichoic acid acyltransferase DltB (MBOAT superfamily)